MKLSLHTVLSAAILAALATSAFAQESYPRIVGGADDYRVEYGPGPAANIIGGGMVQVINEEEGRVAILHESPAFAQTRNDGRLPVMLGGEDDHSVTWVAPTESRQAGRATRPQG